MEVLDAGLPSEPVTLNGQHWKMVMHPCTLTPSRSLTPLCG